MVTATTGIESVLYIAVGFTLTYLFLELAGILLPAKLKVEQHLSHAYLRN